MCRFIQIYTENKREFIIALEALIFHLLSLLDNEFKKWLVKKKSGEGEFFYATVPFINTFETGERDFF